VTHVWEEDGWAQWAIDVMVGEVFTGAPGQLYEPNYLMIDGRQYDFQWEAGTDTPRCGRQTYSHLVMCPLWRGHDGPHLPCSQQLDDQLGRLVITGMTTRSDSP
jgi:hypothetical protein